MKPRKTTYLLHRWLGLIVSLQLLAWSTGGLVFSIFALDNVRGERDIAAPPFEPMSIETVDSLPDRIRGRVAALIRDGSGLASVSFHDRGLGPTWEVRTVDGSFIARLDPETGEALQNITEDDARKIAKRDFVHNSPVSSTRLVVADPPIEYRSGILPAYAVEFDHPKKTRIYIEAQTGRVVARRNSAWRIFDFFWMLHTMDYSGRDNFNHPLLTAFSLLAIGTSGSGLGLWIWRAIPRRRLSSARRSEPGPEE